MSNMFSKTLKYIPSICDFMQNPELQHVLLPPTKSIWMFSPKNLNGQKAIFII